MELEDGGVVEMFSEGGVCVFDGGACLIGRAVGKFGGSGPCGRIEEVQWNRALGMRKSRVWPGLAMLRKEWGRKWRYTSMRKYPRKHAKSGQDCWIDVVRRVCVDRSVRRRGRDGPRKNTG